jgi:hypothetical protein
VDDGGELYREVAPSVRLRPKDMDWLLTCQVAFLAAVDTARAGDDKKRAGELRDVAFLALHRFRDGLKYAGVSIDPYAHETQEERGERFERAAEGMRNAFTEEDWVVIDGARMRNLR